jgi:uncharacterized alkaline shock family protein YloU
MTEDSNPLGSIEISPNAIATIASQAVLQSYGVVGMASKNVVDGLAQRLTRDPRHGVEVVMEDEPGAITINLYIVVEYGTRISQVARSAANSVRFHVERALGMPVGDINVHVQGLRVSNPDA